MAFSPTTGRKGDPRPRNRAAPFAWCARGVQRRPCPTPGERTHRCVVVGLPVVGRQRTILSNRCCGMWWLGCCLARKPESVTKIVLILCTKAPSERPAAPRDGPVPALGCQWGDGATQQGVRSDIPEKNMSPLVSNTIPRF